MHFSSSNRKQKYEYKMKGEILETVSQHPYLGVELSDNLKFNDHIDNITKKIIIYPRIFEKELKILSTKSKRKSLCQPSTSQVGICFTYLESVSKTQQTTRTGPEKCSTHNPISVTEMINHLEWPSLQQHRVWADVTLMYKVVNC